MYFFPLCNILFLLTFFNFSKKRSVSKDHIIKKIVQYIFFKLLLYLLFSNGYRLEETF